MLIRGLRRVFAHFCSGCGAELQHTSADLEGYMPEHKLSNLLLRNQRIRETLTDLRANESIRKTDFWPSEVHSKPQFTEMAHIDDIEEAVKTAVPLYEVSRKPELKQVVCMRCFRLSKEGKVTAVKEAKVVNLEAAKIMEWVSEQIPRGAVILNVMDLMDFEGTRLPKLEEIAQEKDLKVIVIANKVDVLPAGYHIERIHKWVLQQTAAQHVCVVSSASGQGMTKVIGMLKQTKSERPRAPVFVVGVANSGKSSFINRLARMEWDLPMTKFKGVELVNSLTTSPIPGTTMNVIAVDLKKLGMVIKDTPGIPNETQITTHLSEPEFLHALVPRKKLNPIVITLNTEISLFFGGLSRIDLMEGSPKLITVFMSNMVTLHRTIREKADSVFLKHNGNLLLPAYPRTDLNEFKVTNVTLDCVGYPDASKDICVHGLGWVSVTGKGPCSFEIRAPKMVGVTVRPPLMPFEAKPSRAISKAVKTANLKNWTHWRQSLQTPVPVDPEEEDTQQS